MKLLLKIYLIAVLFGISIAIPAFSDPINPVVTATAGHGPNESFFVLNFNDGPGGANDPSSNYVFGYFWDPANGIPSGQDMIDALSNPVGGVGLTVYKTFFPSFNEYFIDGFSYKGHTQNPDGGFDPILGKYWSYWWSSSDRLSLNINDWDYASTGAGDAVLSNGSYDGWVYSDGSASPVTPHSVFVASAATHFVVTTPATTTAGSPFTFTVTAENDQGDTDTAYAGTVHFTSDDPTATLPADTTLVNGTRDFQATETRATVVTLRARDTANANITGTGSTNITAGSATHFILTAPATADTALAFPATVVAKDQFENVVKNYGNIVHLSSSDSQAVLPADFTLTGGARQVSVKLRTPGIKTITATDTTNPGLTAGAFITVGATAAKFVITGPATTVPAASNAFTITVTDTVGNTVTNYSGTVHFQITDPAGAVSANTTLVNGKGTFHATFKTAGTQTVTATDTLSAAIKGTTPITILAGPTSKFVVTSPATTAAGTAFYATVMATDKYGNFTKGYTGTVHITSTDPLAVLPGNITLSNGTKQFGVKLKTSGKKTITATDTVNAAIKGTSPAISVN